MQVPPYNQKVLILKNNSRRFSNNQRKVSLLSSNRLRWALDVLGQPRRKEPSWRKTIWRLVTLRRPM